MTIETTIYKVAELERKMEMVLTIVNDQQTRIKELEDSIVSGELIDKEDNTVEVEEPIYNEPKQRIKTP